VQAYLLNHFKVESLRDLDADQIAAALRMIFKREQAKAAQ
jgi:hypothetical protein